MKYDRDEVKRLERELEDGRDNRFSPYRIGEKTPESKPDPQGRDAMKPETPNKLWLSAKEAAGLLGCGREYIIDLTKLGKCPGFKQGGRWKYPTEQFIEWASKPQQEA